MIDQHTITVRNNFLRAQRQEDYYVVRCLNCGEVTEDFDAESMEDVKANLACGDFDAHWCVVNHSRVMRGQDD